MTTTMTTSRKRHKEEMAHEVEDVNWENAVSLLHLVLDVMFRSKKEYW